jgi:hypothetical protein
VRAWDPVNKAPGWGHLEGMYYFTSCFSVWRRKREVQYPAPGLVGANPRRDVRLGVVNLIPTRSTLLLALALAGAARPAAAAGASEADTAFFRHAAACVAALERDATTMAGRYQSGDRSVKSGLVKLTEQGFSFVGKAYLRGLRKEEADQLTAEARESQKGMSAAALQKLSSDCQAEGGRLYGQASALEQAVVSNRAKARVEKLLAKKS